MVRLHTDSQTLRRYSKDKSNYAINPTHVAFPRTEEDLVDLVYFAREKKRFLIPRGGGTGLAGACLGKGIVVDFSRHMHTILELGKKTRVQPGVLLKDVRPQLEKKGFMLPGVPLHGDCAIGGNVGTRSVGPGTLKYGTIDNQVVSLRGVLADGRKLDTAEKIPTDLAK